jgi:hypothetical protein
MIFINDTNTVSVNKTNYPNSDFFIYLPKMKNFEISDFRF